MPRKPIFVINHDEMLRQTRRMCKKMRQEKDKHERDRQQHLVTLQSQVQAARERVLSLRNNKTSPAFAEARAKLADARSALREFVSAAASWEDEQAKRDVRRMNTIVTLHRERRKKLPEETRRKIRQQQLEEAKSAFSQKRHSRNWDPSTQAGTTILRKVRFHYCNQSGLVRNLVVAPT